jgi:oligopeptide/dipeptide ABC transporter ATP-binding protein
MAHELRDDKEGFSMHARDLVLDFHTNGSFRGSKTFRALDRIDLDVAPGEIVGLVGESGSGKTTLGKAILGIHRPSSGSIFYRNADLASLPTRAWSAFRRDLQMVFQDPLSSFNPRFTIHSSLALALRLHKICPPDQIDAEVANLLIRVGLKPEHGLRFPHELSGGQLQRVAIARAISVKPKIIVADEAVSKLDVSVRAQVLNLLKRTNRETGTSIVFITHDLGVARFLCDRIAVMFFGRIVEYGPSEEVFVAPRHPYTVSLLEARNAKQRTPSLDVEENDLVPRDPARACNYVRRCSRGNETCLLSRPALSLDSDGHGAACFVPICMHSIDKTDDHEKSQVVSRIDKAAVPVRDSGAASQPYQK